MKDYNRMEIDKLSMTMFANHKNILVNSFHDENDNYLIEMVEMNVTDDL